MSTSLLRVVHEDLHDHLYTLYVDHAPRPGQHLGYVDKSADSISILLELADIDLTITQSRSSLCSNTQTSSTGFICWQTALFFADWMLAHPRCPFRTQLSSLVVLELGAGTSGLLASVLGPQARGYVATDQKHLLKLLKKNFVENVATHKYTSTTVISKKSMREKPEWSKIDIVEYDWENAEQDHVMLAKLSGTPDLIFACDTIYNEFLIPHFVHAVKTAMGPNTLVLVAMQLRDESITDAFLTHALEEELEVHVVPDELLSDDLLHGFVVYTLSLPKA